MAVTSTILALLVLHSVVEVHPDGSVEMPAPTRLVFSLTTTGRRISMIKPVIDAIVEGQDRTPDAVYLAVPPDVTSLPEWLVKYNATSRRPGILHVLHMAADYGPASKLLATLREGGERSAETVVVFGDDDILYGQKITELHHAAQTNARKPAAFGSRRIGIGSGSRREELLEATGSISLRASALPESAFDVHRQPDTCRLSDDYWLSHHLAGAGVALELLPRCVYNFNTGQWPQSCGSMREAPGIGHIGALSKRGLAADGSVLGEGGDWRDQLRRYELCQSVLFGGDAAGVQPGERAKQAKRARRGGKHSRRRKKAS